MCDDLFSKSCGRALSTLIAKYNAFKDFNFDVYTYLFNICISSVIMYGSEACGYNKFDKCDNIQYRAMRFFLEVNKYTPNLGLQRDMGWVSLSVERPVYMVRFWNKLVDMKSDRLIKRIFLPIEPKYLFISHKNYSRNFS